MSWHDAACYRTKQFVCEDSDKMVTKSVWGCKWGKTIHDHWSLINGPKIAKTHSSLAGRWYGWDWGLEWKFCKNDPLSFLTNQAPYLLNFNISGELPSAPASERCDLRHQRTKVELAKLDATTDPAWCCTVAYTSCNINPAMMLPWCTWMSARQRQERSRQHN